MAITPEQVAHVARLARLSFDEQELARFTEQLSSILAYAEQVSALATEDVPPTSHAIPLSNVLRPDVIEESLPRDRALANAPAAEDDRFRVPRIIEEPR